MPHRSDNSRLAIQGIAAAMLFGFAFSASAEQKKLALLPAPSPSQSQASSTAAKPDLVAPIPQMKLVPPPIQSGGVSYQRPDLACATNNTPRISNINGTQSGIELHPGSTLNIVGCGFGKGGRIQFSGGGNSVQLRMDPPWNDSNIHAHIDAALGGVLDINGATVTVYPNGAPPISSRVQYSFRAARETKQVPLPPELGVYSSIYSVLGLLSRSIEGQYTKVQRDFTYHPFCPPVTSQQSQLVDVWQIDSSFYKKGFEILDVIYSNRTLQGIHDDYFRQDVLIGGQGGASYDDLKKRVIVTFQAHSKYTKKQLPDAHTSDLGGHSSCTSGYMVSVKVNGPRGVDPFK